MSRDSGSWRRRGLRVGWRAGRGRAVWLGWLLCGFGAAVAAQMPDLRQMSGIPLPSPELPNGAISVRLVRGDLSNSVTSHPVEIHDNKEMVWRGQTDDSGRAQFTDVPSGTLIHVFAQVDGERLESQAFAVPATGGMRLVLVAGIAAAAAAAMPPAEPGTVVFGGDTRFVIELGEDALEVYYLLDIMNGADTPVNPSDRLVFELPAGAQSAMPMQGSVAKATVDGRRVTVDGPFAPGRTRFELGYLLPYASSQVTISQVMPATLMQLNAMVEKVGDMHVGSPQLANHSETIMADRVFIVATGSGVPGGQAMTLQLTGLPYRDRTFRNLALILAFGILGVGLWMAFAPATQPAAPQRRKLEARRDLLFNHLLRIEEDWRAGRMEEARYTARRRELVAQLERVYGALDSDVAA